MAEQVRMFFSGFVSLTEVCPDSKVHVAHVSAPGRPRVGPVNLAIWVAIVQAGVLSWSR